MYARTPTVTALFLASLLVWGCSAKPSTSPDPGRLAPINERSTFG